MYQLVSKQIQCCTSIPRGPIQEQKGTTVDTSHHTEESQKTYLLRASHFKVYIVSYGSATLEMPRKGKSTGWKGSSWRAWAGGGAGTG